MRAQAAAPCGLGTLSTNLRPFGAQEKGPTMLGMEASRAADRHTVSCSPDAFSSSSRFCLYTGSRPCAATSALRTAANAPQEVRKTLGRRCEIGVACGMTQGLSPNRWGEPPGHPNGRGKTGQAPPTFSRPGGELRSIPTSKSCTRLRCAAPLARLSRDWHQLASGAGAASAPARGGPRRAALRHGVYIASQASDAESLQSTSEA